jgi:hypothetical protein
VGHSYAANLTAIAKTTQAGVPVLLEAVQNRRFPQRGAWPRKNGGIPKNAAVLNTSNLELGLERKAKRHLNLPRTADRFRDLAEA